LLAAALKTEECFMKADVTLNLACTYSGRFVRRMKIVFRSTFVALILPTMLLSAGCEKKAAATDPTNQSTPGNTKPLQAADLVGYDGKRLSKTVDRIKQANEKHHRTIERMAESGPDQ
jgi:hypothetical protein